MRRIMERAPEELFVDVEMKENGIRMIGRIRAYLVRGPVV